MHKIAMKSRNVACGFGLALASCALFGCTEAQTCSNIAFERELATFELGCPFTDLTAVTVSGPCAAGGESNLDPAQFAGRGEIGIESDSAGVCHISLTFASGFAYAADVTFISSRSSCGTTDVMPNQATFMVDNPSSTCVDAGADSSAL
jgi:hypothetical protein